MGNEADRSGHTSKPFDIVSTYHELLNSDPDLTMPIAAIEALVLLLTHSPSSTISETLDLLKTHTELLKQAIPNPIGLSAGTDLFQRYIISTLQRPGKLGPAGDFNAIRAHLLSNGRLFIKRAKESRDKIATFGSGFVRDGTTILTNGGSRVVGALLKKVASEGHEFSSSPVRFRVIYVVHNNGDDSDNSQSDRATEGMDTVLALRSKGVPVATIPESAVAYSMGMVDMVIVGAEGVVENGGIISRIGTYQMGLLAKSVGKPFYVVAESHKFVRLYPLGQYDLPITQHVIDFISNDSSATVGPKESKEGSKSLRKRDAVDFTPPHLITALITEGGVLTPSAVSEELIQIWF
ncbi:translation initiation factor eIF-2B subunit alpha [Ophidiomyces ophidiicola]|uniref:Translation initiation factor eIF-2B subunit alpha n=1 Tax=Ophidiomyces ophidiicola TaxID=1387563 RepID=A0ACB8UW42_9EURO|nr:translation initiation factor eIF-2B subunit alpha [Ophidiomyces ophidiicola]KAI1944955.1 translation initiation factor eIF-2B subunit alpha [Ophidiomyces ophidiicola]KAI1945068.1 translation initiation factor eIF-2B subunit alpha [Ophidiomyces ophidiicola]KAI1971181.1 translation initiation factor eIF-2B subunit alpha [Ophidiomyces ophidiicola]KAI2016987.1 translation initiation factor eIF-2B subunit alpha [Ophidiomyces ophidiicola]KAI2050206.1 translation initiation factor eIF-2B subunit 